MAIEIVDFPIKKMAIFHCYVKLPEGSHMVQTNLLKLEQLGLPHSVDPGKSGSDTQVPSAPMYVSENGETHKSW